MTSTPSESPLAVVGIGASAGGIDALLALFKSIDASFDGAIVVVQHLAPDHPSRLADILGRQATLPVVETSDGMVLRSGHIHVIAAGERLTIEGTTLRSVRRGEEAGHTIDPFFASLADACGGLAIAIVLSGAGHDGAAGALRVHQAGGRVLVQDPRSALHDSMPLAAIEAGAADEVLTPEQIGRVLSSGDEHRTPIVAMQDDAGAASIEHVVALILERTGIDLRGFRMSPLAWRVRRRVVLRGLRGFAPYLAMLRDDPHEVHVLVEGLPIHVTSFFRDRHAWDELARSVIVPLVETPGPDAIRAWTPACATGEEAYSVAMSFAEAADASVTGSRDFRVFGTDAIAEVVAVASRGVYPASALAGLAPSRRSRFFTTTSIDGDTSRQVRHALRSKLVFAQHDLLTDPPFDACDLVTCRNFLISLETGTQDRVLARLREALKPGGVLFLGAAEWLPTGDHGGEVPGFDTISRSAHLYRRNATVLVAMAGRAAPDAVDVQRAHATDPPAGVARAPRLERTGGRTDAAEAPIADPSPGDAAASREELQVLHRELESVNRRLLLANRRLAEVDDRLRDQDDEFATRSDAMTLCVDAALRVRWFTSAPSDLVPLRDGDAGRPLTDFATRHADDAFIATLRGVIATGAPADDEVRTGDRWYLRRVHARRCIAGGPPEPGAIVSFVDITARKAAEASLGEAMSRASLLVAVRDRLRTPADPSADLVATMSFLASIVAGPLAAFLDVDRVDLFAAGPGSSPHGVDDGRRWIAARLGDGSELRIDDIDALPEPDSAESWRAAGMRAVLAASPATSGPRAIVVACSAAPHAWTARDATLVAEVAGLAQDALDRALVAAALDDSRQQLAHALKIHS